MVFIPFSFIHGGWETWPSLPASLLNKEKLTSRTNSLGVVIPILCTLMNHEGTICMDYLLKAHLRPKHSLPEEATYHMFECIAVPALPISNQPSLGESNLYYHLQCRDATE